MWVIAESVDEMVTPGPDLRDQTDRTNEVRTDELRGSETRDLLLVKRRPESKVK